MNARDIVNHLLETDRYDIDDPLEKPDVADHPSGFVAVDPADGRERIEIRLDLAGSTPNTALYRVVRHWYHADYYNPAAGEKGKQNTLPCGTHSVHHDHAENWIANERAKFVSKGWQIQPLSRS